MESQKFEGISLSYEPPAVICEVPLEVRAGTPIPPAPFDTDPANLFKGK